MAKSSTNVKSSQLAEKDWRKGNATNPKYLHNIKEGWKVML